MKILRPFTGTGAIFFPVGETCRFATKDCLKNCYANMDKWPNFDEELRVTQEDKHKIRHLLTTMSVQQICDQFIIELDGLQTNILHWFGSGDCLPQDENKILSIINSINTDIIQMGFTRNINLWKTKPDIFALSVENIEDIGFGMYAVADYNRGASSMFYNGKPTRGGVCGPELCCDENDLNLIHFINCKTCKRLKTGCFDRSNI